MTNSTRPIIEITNLVKQYELLPVLRKLNLIVERGEFVALLGPNGSGKSTLLRLLCAITRPTSGEIRIGGWLLPQEVSAVRSQIGLVSHKPLFYENLTAVENLTFFGRLYNVPANELGDRTRHLLDDVGLGKRAHDLARTFSRGMQQRLSIARALLHNPDVLLFDEPYTGLDQSAGTILDGLLSKAHAGGRTIIMTTHQLERAETIVSRVVILKKGQVGYDEPVDPNHPPNLVKIYTDVTGMVNAL